MEVFLLRKATALFVLALFAAATAPSGARASIVDTFCADRWPGDRAMIKRCVESQLRAVSNLNRFVRRHEIRRKSRRRTKIGPYEKMYLACGRNAAVPHNGTRDFVKFIRCLDKREKAYKSLHPDGK